MDRQVQNIVFGFQLFQSGVWIAQTYLLEEEFEEFKIIRVCAFNIIAFRSLETILQKYRQNQYIYQFTLICRLIYFISLIEISMSQATDITLSNTTNSIIFMIIFFNQQYKKVVHFKYLAHILQVYALFRVGTYYESIYYIIEPGVSIIIFAILTQRHIKDFGQGDKYMTRAFKVQSVSEGFKRPQLVNNSFDEDEDVEQIGKISQEIINLFPLGIVVVNSKKQVEFMNPRCERILEVNGEQNVMDTINRAYTLSCSSEQPIDDNIIMHSISQCDLVDTFLGRKIKGSGVSVLDDPQSSAIKHKFNYSFYSKEHHSQQKLRIQVVTGSQDKYSSIEGTDNRHNILFLLIKNVTQKTHLKKLEQELHFQNSLLKSFSHELRTPLNCSIQMLTLAKQKASEDIMENLNIAQTQNQLLIFQINDILDFAAFQCSSFQYQWNNFYIKELFTEVMDLYEYQCRNKHIKLSFDIDEVMMDMQVLSDKQRIMQVLVNLMNNSLKFTAKNGFIIIKLQLLNPGQFQIAVCDNGVGIQEQKFKKMSSQLKDTNDTFGLGINVSSKIVWGLAKQNLEIHSQPGKGTRMTFIFINKDQDQGGLSQPRNSQVYAGSELPLIYKDMSPQLQDMQEGDFVCVGSSQHMINSESDGIDDSDEEGGLKANPNTFFKMKSKHCQCIDILIVDDVPSNQIALKCLFKSLKLNIDQAYDGMSAIQQVKDKMYSNCCQNYAVIIMDIEMPNMDGFEASTKILQISQTNIIMCSAYGGIANSAQAQKVGISDTLSKPVRREELIKLLQKYMDYT